MMIFGHPLAPVHLGRNEWLFVALATVIILAILGGRILRELRAIDD
jgi:hypothetical protein